LISPFGFHSKDKQTTSSGHDKVKQRFPSRLPFLSRWKTMKGKTNEAALFVLMMSRPALGSGCPGQDFRSTHDYDL
jgi:hypothetical protein